MRRRYYAVVRFFSPRLAQRLELRDKGIKTRPAAYRGAFEIADTVGPMEMAEDLGLVGLPYEQLAAKIAEEYHPEARAQAKQGTLDGFQSWLDRKIEER